MRRFFWPLLIFIGVLVFAGSVLSFLIFTQSGNIWLMEKSAKRFADSIKIGKIKGNLFSDLHFFDVKLRKGEHEAHIIEGFVKFDIKAILINKYHLRRLFLKGITYYGPEYQDILSSLIGQQPSDNWPFPNALKIKNAKIVDVHIQQKENSFYMPYIEFAGQADPTGIYLEKMNTRIKEMFFSLQATYNNDTQVGYNGQIKWRGTLPNKSTVQGRCNFKGNLQQVELKIFNTSPIVFETKTILHINKNQTHFTFKGKSMPPSEHISSNYDMASNMAATSFSHKRNMLETSAIKINHINDQKNLKNTVCQDNISCLFLENIKAKTLRGHLKINGFVELEPPGKIELAIEGENIDPGLEWPELPGDLTLHANIEGWMLEKNPAIHLKNVVLSGQLLTQPIHASGNLSIFEEGLFSENFVIHSKQNKIEIWGGTYAQEGLTFQAIFVDPEDLWPYLKGSIEMRGNLMMNGENPILSLFIEGQPVSYGHFKIENMKMNLKYGPESTGIMIANMDIKNLKVAGELLSALRLSLKGDFNYHHLAGRFEAPSDILDFEVFGNYNGHIWEASVISSTIDSQKFGTWHLSDKFNILVSQTEVKPFEPCLLQNKEKICLKLSWNEEEGWKYAGDVDASPLNWITVLVRELLKWPTG